jgi:ATP-dependent Clp protease, protease subunit
MSLRNLPEVKAFQRPEGLHWDAPSDAMARWVPGVSAADAGSATVSIYDAIGEDAWTGGGFTARRMDGALRAIGSRPVTVKINSPGGDFFEGLAIYNQLREHPAEVTVQVMGLAASAASIIAMAGDRIEVGQGAFLMIHNAWAMAIGNRHDMRQAADVLEPFDAAMADIYAGRTGYDRKKVADMMDAATWLGAGAAVEAGFADAIIDGEPPEAVEARADVRARNQIESILAKAGLPRSERRRLIKDLNGGMRDAAADVTRDAGDPTAEILSQLTAILRS